MSAIVTSGLTRKFSTSRGDVTALNDFSLAIAHGEVHGLLGPNGAGKTTLIKVLATLLLPTSGTARICGFDVVSQAHLVRENLVVVLGGERGLYSKLSGRHNLEFWAAVYGFTGAAAKRRVDQVLSVVGLHAKASAISGTYSRGMKQRLHIARGLLSSAKVVVLDEPTVGMDPVGVEAVREIVKTLRAEGRAVLMATHDMADAARLCDSVTVMKQGERLLSDKPASIARTLAVGERISFVSEDHAIPRLVGAIDGVSSVQSMGDGCYRLAVQSEAKSKEVMTWLLGAGVTHLSAQPPSLEEAYLEVFRQPIEGKAQ